MTGTPLSKLLSGHPQNGEVAHSTTEVAAGIHKFESLRQDTLQTNIVWRNSHHLWVLKTTIT